jgi:hypothetical protein
MKKTKHTELPWQVFVSRMLGDITGKIHEITILPKSRYRNQQVSKCFDIKEIGRNGGLTQEEADANAEFIVKACNHHYQLVEALKRVSNCNDLATAQEYSREILSSLEQK